MGCCTSSRKTNLHKRIIKINKNNYTISNVLIGEGHYGKVYECFKNKTALKAIKIIKHIYFKKNEKIALNIIKSNKHSNIMFADEIYNCKNYYYIISDYYNGSDFYDIITTRKFKQSEIYVIMKQILKAIKHLHELGIVHRDIKPENILIEKNLSIKLIDFGLAKIEPDICIHKNTLRKWTKVGTSYYMPPEVLLRFYNQLCDEWSTGIIYHVLTVGYPIYNGSNDSAIIYNIKHDIKIVDEKDWKLVNELHKKIIHLLLERDLSKRKSAKYILNYYMNKKSL